MNDIYNKRLKAIREAWKNERAYVREGKGTRDWAQSEQREIVAKGRADGYEGHHMKSVKDYPQHAGNPNNIQFLNRNEHVNGAHSGNTQNATNGYYNPKTGTMHSFGNRDPQAPQPHALSLPLTQKQQNLALKREQIRKQAAQQAKAEIKQDVTKMPHGNTQAQNSQAAVTNKGIESMRIKSSNNPSSVSQNSVHTSQNKGIDAMRQKTANKQSGANVSQPGQSTNQGIKSYQNKVNGQTTNASQSNSGSPAKGSGAGTGDVKSGGSSSGGQSSGSGQQR